MSNREFRLFGSTVLTILLTAVFIIKNQNIYHWFIIPTTISGILIGTEMMRWFQKGISLLDLRGIVGIIGYYLFFVSVLMLVNNNFSLYLLKDSPSDWRTWYGIFSSLNSLGLLVYLWLVANQKLEYAHFKERIQILSISRLKLALLFVLFCSLISHLVLLFSVGGFSNYVDLLDQRIGAGQGNFVLAGKGSLVVLGEMFPILTLFYFAVTLQGNKKKMSPWLLFFVFLIVVIGLRIFFGGIRGSRHLFVLDLFWIASIIHLWFNSFKKFHLGIGILIVFAFMSISFFFKHGGSNSLSNLFDNDFRESVLESRRSVGGDHINFILLADFSRANIQTYAIYKTLTTRSYEYAFGRTYLGAAFTVVPQWILPFRKPETARKERTHLLYGEQAYFVDGLQVPYLFGLQGEALLNFGLIGFILSFGLLGILVRISTSFINNLDRYHIAHFLIPFVLLFNIYFLLNDSHTVMKGMMAYFLIFLTLYQTSRIRNKKIRIRIK